MRKINLSNLNFQRKKNNNRKNIILKHFLIVWNICSYQDKYFKSYLESYKNKNLCRIINFHLYILRTNITVCK